MKEIYRRHKKYSWKIFLSRYEYKDFWITEWWLRKELRELRRNWLLTIWKEYCWEERFANVYKLSEELLELLISKFRKYKTSFDILNFNKNTPLEEIKNLLWIKGFSTNFVINSDSNSKYTFNSENNIITRWSKKNKHDYTHYNLFNWLKELFWMDTKTLISNLV